MTGDPHPEPRARRPLKTRRRPAAAALAAWLARRRVEPNHVSAAGILVAALGGACLIALPHVGEAGKIALLVAAPACIQLRLLANLMDGMVAVEGGRRTATGELWNDIPDRVADVLILAGAGYAITWASWGDVLGWAAAAAALLTAYVRLLGGSLGVSQQFCGPMAKQQRMAVMSAACLLSLVETAYGYAGRVLTAALIVVVAGAVVTFARRTLLIARELRTR